MPARNAPDSRPKVKKNVGRCFEVVGEKLDDSSEKETTIHYYIEVLKNGSIAIEKVDPNGEPSGDIVKENLTIEEFNKSYHSCSRHKCSLQPRTLEEITKKMAENRVDLGEEHLKNGDVEAAEEKFLRALEFDEENVRALFGVGKVKMENNLTDDAVKIFQELVRDNAIFEMSNKHTFNDFGIYLRKNGLYSMAICCYERAITIDNRDPALYFNLGRAYTENGAIQKGIEKLKEALEIDPDFPEAKDLLEEYLQKEQEMLDKLFE